METIFNVITSNLANKMPFKSLFKELEDANMNSEQKLKYLKCFQLIVFTLW